MTATRSIAKNTMLLTIGLLMGRALSVPLVNKMSPILGDQGIGIWGLATDLSAILLVIARFGLDTLLTREITRSRGMTLPLFWSTLKIRWTVGAACYLFLIAFVKLSGYGSLKSAAVLVTGIGIFVEATAMACDSVLQAHEKVQYQSMGQIMSAVVYVGLGWWALDSGYGLMGVIWANLASKVIRLTVMAPLMFWKTGPWQWQDPDWVATGRPVPDMRWLMALSFPLFLSTTFGIIYNKVDTVMLNAMLGDAVAGVYVLGHRALDMMIIVPNIFGTALFPAMARYSFKSSSDAVRLGERSLRFILAAMFPLTLFLMFTARPIIGYLSDGSADFHDSSIVLMIVIWGVPLQAANIIFNRLLITAEKEKSFVIIGLVSMITNVVLNSLLIPRYSYYGASVATLISLGVSFVLHARYLRGSGFMPPLVRAVVGPAAALVLGWGSAAFILRMAVPGWGTGWLSLPLEQGWGPFLGAVFLTGLMYLLALVVLRVLRRDDLGLLEQILNR
jgi:O-antigen/teichoic acid export membrane protein